LGGALLAYPAFSFMTFRKATKRRIVFQTGDQAGSVNFKDGVYLIREPDEIVALSARCTHLGCTLNYEPVSQRFACPCHGSVFTLSGKRVAGPARKDLCRVPLTSTVSGDIEAVLEIG